uniref:Treble-clef zinc-finger domain-containing protein n=1 Tax=Stomoxys calcitrans TaxID=35570 RepID=A0A1I8NUN1_STOCA
MITEPECEKLNKSNILNCSSWGGGSRKCPSCGFVNTQRTIVCRNLDCGLRKSMLAAIKPYDPIQLVTYNDNISLYSLRIKEKLSHVRNFVGICVTQSSSLEVGYPKAVCYVDECKYDGSAEAPVVNCKHVKAIKYSIDNIPQAEVYVIDKEVMWSLKIAEAQKQNLWDLYCRHKNEDVPCVQRLNSSTFVVGCDGKMNNFPAGRLHVTVCANSLANKKGFYLCACKKLKIVVEPDYTVIMKKEICDHLLLLLAAILSRSDGNTMYGAFLEAMQHLWVTSTPKQNADSSSNLIDFDMSSLIDSTDKCEVNSILPSNPVDLFNYSEDLFSDNTIPDFSDMIFDVDSDKLSPPMTPLEEQPKVSTSTPELKFNITKKSDVDYDFDFNFPTIKSSGTMSPLSMLFDSNENSLIEQFHLNEDVQVSCDNIALAKDIENLNNLESQVTPNLSSQVVQIKQEQEKEERESTINPLPLPLPTPPSTPAVSDSAKTVIIKPKSNQVFINNKSVIVKQSPVKIIKITTPGVIRKLPKIDKKFIQISKIDSSKLIVLNSKTQTQTQKSSISIQPANNLKVTSTVPSPPLRDAVNQPFLSYEAWLDHIIEILNDSIILQDSNNIKHTFHVHEDMFSCFSKTFGFNDRPRLPNFTQLITSGKHKGLVKYGWYFNQAAAVKRIFSTKKVQT